MIFLSHLLNDSTPLYGNGNGIELISDKQINIGDSCNTMSLCLPNHSGTHIDFPYHFNPNGNRLNDYPASFWEFNNVELIDLTGKIHDCQIIGCDMFQDIKDKELELLLIKTGYGSYRGTNRYTLTPPGLSYELADYFREKYPKLRCIGMDLISISSYSNRNEGRKAHNAFLNPDENEPILIIEDMKLDQNGPFNKVIVAPLLIKEADGAPCTIFAYSKL